MAELNIETVIKSGVEKALNKPIMNGKSILEWAKIGMDSDRVKVVRCRDCESWWPDTNEENCSSGLCRNQFGICGGQTTDMNWFCADGEKEE